MKTVATIIFAFFLSVVYGQTDDYKILLDSAKTLFNSKESRNREEQAIVDYSQVVSMLEKVIQLNPNSTEARYYLGCTFSRMNAWDGESMIQMNLELVYQASEQFEQVIQQTPKYIDEISLIDPYSKLMSEWGSMAMNYRYHNMPDSAIWAFKEGKKRGGFRDFFLEANKSILDACSQNSILISSGDYLTIPLWYLQTVENHRTDVAVVDISLLNSNWYPAFLSRSKSVAFDVSNEELETIDYIRWTDTNVTINNFTWTVKPSYYGHLLRGDRLFLSLLKENKFQRDVFFTVGFMEESRLSLKDYILPLIIVDKLSISDNELEYNIDISKILKLSEHLDFNSPDEQILFDSFRFNIIVKINDYLENNDKEKARELIELLDKYAPDTKIPYINEKWKEYLDYLRDNI